MRDSTSAITVLSIFWAKGVAKLAPITVSAGQKYSSTYLVQMRICAAQ